MKWAFAILLSGYYQHLYLKPAFSLGQIKTPDISGAYNVFNSCS